MVVLSLLEVEAKVKFETLLLGKGLEVNGEGLSDGEEVVGEDGFAICTEAVEHDLLW